MSDLQAIFESLTIPDKEDQIILVLHDGTVHVVAVREFPRPGGKREVQARQYRIPLDDFKRTLRDRPASVTPNARAAVEGLRRRRAFSALPGSG